MNLSEEVVRELTLASVPVALIGGLALAVHGVSRSTLDVDFLVTDRRVLSESFWRTISDSGAEVDVRRGDDVDPLAGVARLVRKGETPVEVVVGKGAWLDGVLRRRTIVRVDGLELPVVDAADLLFLKLHAGGPQDLLDVRLVLASPEGRNVKERVQARLSEVPPDVQAAWRRMV